MSDPQTKHREAQEEATQARNKVKKKYRLIGNIFLGLGVLGGILLYLLQK